MSLDFTIAARPCVCFRCQRSIRGYGFYTLYGSLDRPDGTRVQACGEFVHHQCPAPDAPARQAFHDEDFGAGKPRPSRARKHISNGIDLLYSGRYSARHNKKRLGTHLTIAEAQKAVDRYKRTLQAEAI